MLNFDSESKGGREQQSQVWPGGTAIVRVSCDRQVGEGRFEAGCVATLEQREMRADGFRGEWQRVAAARATDSSRLPLSQRAIDFRATHAVASIPVVRNVTIFNEAGRAFVPTPRHPVAGGATGYHRKQRAKKQPTGLAMKQCRHVRTSGFPSGNLCWMTRSCMKVAVRVLVARLKFSQRSFAYRPE